MITYLLPTRDRPERLQQTLAALESLDSETHECVGGAEVVVVDNASEEPVRAPKALSNGFRVHVLRLNENKGAAGRNVGAEFASGEWLVMLDDDSFPLDSNHVQVLLQAEDDVAAIGAEILLPNGRHEAGGLPEVFIGCGAAIRRDAFLETSGYDPAFDYYAEEYDLCAKLLLQGWRIVHDFRFRVLHEKVAAGRDMNRILHRLVRNNCWVMQRYAPAHIRDQHVLETIARYGEISIHEHAALGFASGMSELIASQAGGESSMADDLFDRFTGLSHARRHLGEVISSMGVRRVSISGRGKNCWAIEQALRELGVQIVEPGQCDLMVIGTLSPGPMSDTYCASQGCAITPWRPENLLEAASVEALERQRDVSEVV